MYSKHTIIKISLYTVYSVILVGVILLGFEWGSTYVENQQQASYEDVPFELKLKSVPEDVLYSEAFKTASGTDIVKYAYLAGDVSPILDEDISRRTPVSQTAVLETFKDEAGKDMEKLKTTFISSPQMYQDKGVWRQIEYATTTPEVFAMSGAIPHIKRRELAEKILPGESVFAVTSTFYPDPNTESTSVDGHASQEEFGTDNLSFFGACLVAWSNAQPGTGTASADNITGITVESTSGTFFNSPDYECTVAIYRAVILFDTASLPDTATISAATFSLYVTGKSNFDNDGNDTLNIVSSTPAANTAVVNGDYDSLGTTLYASAADITSVTTSAYNVFTLNSTGRDAITKTSATKFGIREGHDINNDTVTPGTGNQVTFSAAETSGTSQDPKLEVTYTVASTFSMGNWFPF